MRWLGLVVSLVLLAGCQHTRSDEVDKANAEAAKARAEADKARAEADKARAEADKARAEADLRVLQSQGGASTATKPVVTIPPTAPAPAPEPPARESRRNCPIEDWDPYEQKCAQKKR